MEETRLGKKATGSPKVRGKSLSFKENPSPQKKEKRKRKILLHNNFKLNCMDIFKNMCPG